MWTVALSQPPYGPKPQRRDGQPLFPSRIDCEGVKDTLAEEA